MRCSTTHLLRDLSDQLWNHKEPFSTHQEQHRGQQQERRAWISSIIIKHQHQHQHTTRAHSQQCQNTTVVCSHQGKTQTISYNTINHKKPTQG